MALKVVLSQAERDSLDDKLKAEYKLKEDGNYHLDLGGVYVSEKDPSTLMTALEYERAENKKVKELANKFEKELQDIKLGGTTDIEELKKHYQQEVDKVRKEFKEQQKAQEEQLQKQKESAAVQFRNQEALRISTELFGEKAALMLPHIRDSLKPVVGDTPKVEIIDPNSGTSSLNQDLKDFQKSFSTNPLFADMIVASRASGSSANDGGNASPDVNDKGEPKTYKDYTPAELLAIKRESPEKFSKLKATL